MTEIYDEREDLKVISTDKYVVALLFEAEKDQKELKSRHFKDSEELAEWNKKIKAHRERHSKVVTTSYLDFDNEVGRFTTPLGPDSDLIEFLEKTAMPSLKSESQSFNGGDN